MEVKVSEETYNFYLALDEWTPVVGHEVKVGDFRFGAMPNKEYIVILEIASGELIQKIPVDIFTFILTSTKEGTIDYLEKVVGETLKNGLEKNGQAHLMLSEIRKSNFKRLGKMPPIYEVDVESIENNNQLH